LIFGVSMKYKIGQQFTIPKNSIYSSIGTNNRVFTITRIDYSIDNKGNCEYTIYADNSNYGYDSKGLSFIPAKDNDLYHVFIYNEYDGIDYIGEYNKTRLRAKLLGIRDDRDIGHEKLNRDDIIVIKGEELSSDDLYKVAK